MKPLEETSLQLELYREEIKIILQSKINSLIIIARFSHCFNSRPEIKLLDVALCPEFDFYPTGNRVL